jgi:ABC-type transport system substrate-binding protein
MSTHQPIVRQRKWLMYRSRLAAGVALLAVVALVAAGCGGGSGSNSSASKAASPASSVQDGSPGDTDSANPTAGIPQNNGGDHDADNNGGPSDGDGNI